jgi:hypothetical protein
MHVYLVIEALMSRGSSKVFHSETRIINAVREYGWNIEDVFVSLTQILFDVQCTRQGGRPMKEKGMEEVARNFWRIFLQ